MSCAKRAKCAKPPAKSLILLAPSVLRQVRQVPMQVIEIIKNPLRQVCLYIYKYIYNPMGPYDPNGDYISHNQVRSNSFDPPGPFSSNQSVARSCDGKERRMTGTRAQDGEG